MMSIEDLQKFGQNLIKEAIEEHEKRAQKQPEKPLTQKEAAAYLGKSVMTLIRWEKEGYLTPTSRCGKTPYYSAEVLKKIKG